MKVILGSQSKFRQEILKKIVSDFEVMPADIDEKAIRSENYYELPLLLARAKAETLRGSIHENAILLTSDQVVLCNGELREKPESKEEARRYLESYGTFPAETVTAVVATNLATGLSYEAVDRAKVTYRPINEEVITALIDEGKVMKSAGGFLVEHPLLMPYRVSIDGDINSVKGLPLDVTRELLIEAGLPLVD